MPDAVSYMAESGAIDFEPEIVFPANPFDAARTYLGVMAYPERGAGQPGGLGVAFGEALWSYAVWYDRKARGLRHVREKIGDPGFTTPKKREFEGALNRGMRRVDRRIAALELVGTQFLNGFFAARGDAARLVAEGRPEAAFVATGKGFGPIRPEIWSRATPSPRKVVRSQLGLWADRFSLNETGAPADPTQKEKDIIRRGFLQSRPVLHMAHGLNEIYSERGPKLAGWDKHDPLLVLLWTADLWVWDAIDTAEQWRFFSRFQHAPGIDSTQMIVVTRPEKCEITHPDEPDAPAP